MSDASPPPIPARPIQPPQATGTPVPAPDPGDLGTAYGMEMSIDGQARPEGADEDADDPLAWIRRWVQRHKGP